MAELAIGIVSLSFQVFSGCIKGYQLLSDARDLEKAYGYVRIKLHIEQTRLLNWGRIAKIHEGAQRSIFSLHSRGLVLSILEQQQDLLFRFGRYDERTARLAEPIIIEDYSGDGGSQGDGEQDPDKVQFPQAEVLLRKALEYAHATGRFPKKLRWAICDKKKMDEMLVKISSLNDYLTETLSSDQMAQLSQSSERTYYQILQLNSSVTQLLDIMKYAHRGGVRSHRTGSKAATAGFLARSVRDDDHQAGETQNQDLARIKAIKASVQRGTISGTTAQQLGLPDSSGNFKATVEKDSITMLEDAPGLPLGLEYSRTRAKLQNPRTRADTRVWIEWMTVEPPKTRRRAGSRQSGQGQGMSDTGRDTVLNRRLTAVITLLRDQEVARSLQAVPCVGYFLEKAETFEDDARCGLIFETPGGYSPDDKGVSLLELMKREDFTPTLSQRIAMSCAISRCLERLHAIDWLHKGIRSHNVLFFRKKSPGTKPDGEGDPVEMPSDLCGLDLSSPFLSGFDYSRPESETDWTQKGELNPAHDIYRHPQVQVHSGRDSQETKESFKKVFDIYSLGVVLLEIAYWKPIHAILDINLEQARLKDTVPVRKSLLDNPTVLGRVRVSSGDTLFDVIKTCLVGASAFGLPDEYKDVASDDAVVLQSEFYAQVVQKLESVKV